VHLQTIEEQFKGTFDFFYLPIDFKNKCNVGYAFINMLSPQYIPPLVARFNNKRWDKFNSEKVSFLAFPCSFGLCLLFQVFSMLGCMQQHGVAAIDPGYVHCQVCVTRQLTGLSPALVRNRTNSNSLTAYIICVVMHVCAFLPTCNVFVLPLQVCNISYGRIQGRAALISHFQNSSLMHEDKRCRPVLFISEGPDAGEPEPFPMGVHARPRGVGSGSSGGSSGHLAVAGSERSPRVSSGTISASGSGAGGSLAGSRASSGTALAAAAASGAAEKSSAAGSDHGLASSSSHGGSGGGLATAAAAGDGSSRELQAPPPGLGAASTAASS
jgi:hypothetical protein